MIVTQNIADAGGDTVTSAAAVLSGAILSAADTADTAVSQSTDNAMQIKMKTAQASRNTEPFRPLISFIDDDGNDGILTKLKPLFTAKSIPIGLALPGNCSVITDDTKRAGIVDLQDNFGWEILSHTMTHTSVASMTNAELEADCRTFLTTFDGYGLNVNSIAYPWGQVNPAQYPIISKYFISAFSTASTYNSLDNMNDYYINRFGLGSNMAPGYDTLGAFKALIDSAKTNTQWLVFMLHCDYPGNDMQIISDVLDYAIAQGIEIVAPNDGLRVFGGILQSGRKESSYFNVKANGYVDTNRYSLVERIAPKLETDAPDANGGYGVPTTKTFNVESWSIGQGIVTEHIMAAAWEYQEFRKSGSDVSYWMRKWDGAKWNNWERISTKLSDISYTMPAITISAGSTIDMTVYEPTILADCGHIAAPVGAPDTGIMWNCWSNGNGALNIRMYNTLAVDVALEQSVWTIKRIN